MDILSLIGRILLGGFFIMNGLNHFKSTEMLTGYAASKGVPSPKITVYATGVLIIAGGTGVILGVLPQLSLAILAVFLLVVSFQMHDFWNVSEQDKMSQKQNFMKNIAILGAILVLLMFAPQWPLTL